MKSFSHETKKRVLYGETDKMGYLYYGHYAQYYETGRVEMLRELGLTYRALEDEYKIMMPVTSMNVRYLRPAYYDDLLTIRTTLKELPTEKITFHMEIFNENGKLLNAGRVGLRFVSMETGKVVKAPDVMLDKLRKFF